MVRAFLLLLVSALAASGADDPWAKVKALKTGAEIRVYKKGSAQPVLAQMADLTDDNLVILVKKTQTAIPKDQIDRIDARPSAGPATKETTTKEGSPPGDPTQQTTTTTTSYDVSGKPAFETVYKRPAGAPKK